MELPMIGVKLIQLTLFFVLCLRFRAHWKWVLLAALIPTLSLLTPGSYESGDFTTHIVRVMDMYTSLEQGIFPVRWAWLLNGGYGYPLFSFMTVLPYYFISLLHALSLSFVASMKIALALAYVSAGISMWLCVRALFRGHAKKDLVATVAALFYVFAPYMLINLEFRAALGELTGFALLPLIFYSVLEKRRLLFTFSLAILLLSHPGITLLGVPWIMLYLLLKKQWSFVFPTVLAAGIASFFLVPALAEARYTLQVTKLRTVWTPETIPGFQPFMWLFWSPWRYGLLLQGHYGEVANVLGPAQWASIVVVLYLLLKKQIQRRDKNMMLVLVGLAAIGIFMMSSLSRPVWNALPLIRQLQFPSRIMAYCVFSSAIITGYVFSFIAWRPLLWKGMLFLAIGWSVLNWSHRTFHPEVDDAYLQKRLNNVSFEYERLPEAMPVGLDKITGPRTTAFSVTSLKHATLISEHISPVQHSYSLNMEASGTLYENTLYFPGWKVYLDNKQIDMSMRDNGTMTVELPAGEHILSFRFEDTPLRAWSNQASLISFGIFILWGVYASALRFSSAKTSKVPRASRAQRA